MEKSEAEHEAKGLNDEMEDRNEDGEQGHFTHASDSNANENLDESSVEEGNEDLKAKIPELTSKKFIRDSGIIRDNIWIIPYSQEDPYKVNLSTNIAFPIKQIKVYADKIAILDSKPINISFGQRYQTFGY